MKVPMSKNAKLLLRDPKALREFMTAMVSQDESDLDAPIEISSITVHTKKKQQFELKLKKGT